MHFGNQIAVRDVGICLCFVAGLLLLLKTTLIGAILTLISFLQRHVSSQITIPHAKSEKLKDYVHQLGQKGSCQKRNPNYVVVTTYIHVYVCTDES